MKFFAVSFNGRFIGGDMIISDETELKAFNRFKKELVRIGLFERNLDIDFQKFKSFEIPLDKPTVYTLSDGDY